MVEKQEVTVVDKDKAIMTLIKEGIDAIAKRDIETSKINADREVKIEEIKTGKTERKDKRRDILVFSVIFCIMVMGTIFSIKMFSSGRIDLAYTIASSTITGVLGFLGGIALGK